MENESEVTNAEGNLDTSRSSASEDVSSPRAPYALHTGDADHERGDVKASSGKALQKQSKSPKPPQTEQTPPTLRAPYAQPVLDASKIESRPKSSIQERLASAKERRLQQEKQIELDLRLKREKENQAHMKWMQSQEDKRKKMEETRAKEDAHRKEVEQRKKQQLEEEKKKAEAKVAKTEQVYEVKMRQKRSTSSDRAVKRWSWGGGGGGGGSGTSHGDSPSLFHYFDATRLTKWSRSAGKEKRPASLHASHFDVSHLGKYYSNESTEQKSVSQVNLTGATNKDRFSHSPLHVNTSHISFASGLRSYDSKESVGKGTPPGRPSAQPMVTEQLHVSPRLLAPTRASLARSRQGLNELEDGASTTSNDTKPGPMRSRSKDRRVKDQPSAARASAKSVPERKSTPTRGTSPAYSRRAPSPAALQSLVAPTASSEAKKVSSDKPSTDPPKPKRGLSPQPRPKRAPSPAKPMTPPLDPTKKKRAPSPATARSSPKSVASETPKSTPPSIKQSLRPTAQMKPRSSTKPSVRISSDSPKLPLRAAESTKPKKPQVTPSQPEKTKEPEQSHAEKPQSKEPPTTVIGTTASDSLLIIEESDKMIPPLQFTSETSMEQESKDSDQLLIIEEPSNAEQASALAVDQPNTDQLLIIEDTGTVAPTIEKTVEQSDELLIVEDSDKADTTGTQPAETETEEPLQRKSSEEESSNTVESVNQNAAPLVSLITEDDQTALQSDSDTKDDSDSKQESEIQIAAESGFHLNEQEVAPLAPPNVTTMKAPPNPPRSLSPTDSLEEIEQQGDENKEEVVEVPEMREAWLNADDENKENIEPTKEPSQEPEDQKMEESRSVENDAEVVTETAAPETQDPELESDNKEAQTVQEVADEEATVEEPEEPEIIKEASEAIDKQQSEDDSSKKVPEDASDEVENAQVSEEKVEPPPVQEEEQEVKPSQTEEEEKSDPDSAPSSENTPTERKSLPRKSLATDEAKEAYRQAIAEKRRELKEKKEQEERERQERIRLAKIEQAKREEEARRMFEEAAAEAEREKKLEEERRRQQEEEERRKEELINAQKREAAERIKKEREMQKQKQEDERLERKKRLEMIMRRTRQPDANSTRSKTDENAASPTASPQHTPVSHSPATGRSPTVQSPVGGLSPMTATTPERSVSPAVAAILSRTGIDSGLRSTDQGSKSCESLPTFTNSAEGSSPLEKPTPHDSHNPISNGLESGATNHNSDPLGLFSNGDQTNPTMNGSDQVLGNQEPLITGL